MQVDRMAKEAGYIAETAPSVQDAEMILDKWDDLHNRPAAG
jgi:hypothetical protein